MFGSPISIFMTLIIFTYGGPLSEEFGWRGFATKKLVEYYNMLKVCIIIGIIWSIWHYPLFFLNGQYNIDNYFTFFPLRFLKDMSIATIITYFYLKTNKSVLSTMIIHFLSNLLINLFYPFKITTDIIHAILLVIISIILIIKGEAEFKKKYNGL